MLKRGQTADLRADFVGIDTKNPAVRGWLASGCSEVDKPPSGSTAGCGQRPATLKLGVEAVLQGGTAVVALENSEHGPAEIGGMALESLQADAAKLPTHGLGIPEQLPGRPGHHAHRVVTGLDQALLEPVLL